ncbi:hypothetical protein RUND412_007407 [Rhizina undulata]
MAPTPLPLADATLNNTSDLTNLNPSSKTLIITLSIASFILSTFFACIAVMLWRWIRGSEGRNKAHILPPQPPHTPGTIQRLRKPMMRGGDGGVTFPPPVAKVFGFEGGGEMTESRMEIVISGNELVVDEEEEQPVVVEVPVKMLGWKIREVPFVMENASTASLRGTQTPKGGAQTPRNGIQTPTGEKRLFPAELV